MREFANTKKQGDWGLGIAIGWFASRGLTVSIPLSDSQAYDLVVDDDGLKRVQVKASVFKRLHYEVNLSTKGGNQTFSTIKRLDDTKIDALFIVVGDGTMYYFPIEATDARSHLVLGKKYKKYTVEW